MKKLTLSAAIISILSIILYIVAFIAIDESISTTDKILFSSALLASLGFGILAMVLRKYKMLLLIPIIAIVVVSSFVQSYSEALVTLKLGEAVASQTSFETLEFLILVGYIVSLVFALKEHKWASITAIVILALNIVSLYSNILVLAGLQSANLEVLDKSSFQSYFCYIMVCLGLMLTDIAIIVYFTQNLIQDKKEVKNEDTVENETVKTE